MIDVWTIYWVTRLDALRVAEIVAFASTGVTFGAAVLFWMLTVLADDKDATEGLRKRRRLFASTGFLSVVFGVAAVFTPTTKEAAAMLVIPAIVNDEDVQSEASDLYRLAKRWLEDAVDGERSVEETGE